MMSLDFKERHILGRPSYIEVRKGQVLIGTIGQSAGEYRYYRGEHNELTPSFSDPDLEALKRRIEAAEHTGPN